MIMGDISLIVRQMRVFAEREMAGNSLGFPEQIVLMYLMDKGVSNQDQIACFYAIDKGAIAKSVKKLEEKGLIVREVNPRKKREKILSLTPAAHVLLEQMGASVHRWEAAIFQGMSVQERSEAERMLHQMACSSLRLTHEE